MKKIILAALAVVTIAPANAETSVSKFAGFYAGAQIGVNSANVKFNPPENGTVSGSKRSTTFLGGLFTGYGMGIFSCAYLGAEVYLNMTPMKVNFVPTANGSVSLSYKSNYNLGGKLRLGYTITPKVMAFLGLGGEFSKTKVVLTGSNNSSGSLSKNLNSLVPSVGADIFANNNIFVRTELSYSIPKTQSFDGILKVKTNQTRFVVGAGYKF